MNVYCFVKGFEPEHSIGRESFASLALFSSRSLPNGDKDNEIEISYHMDGSAVPVWKEVVHMTGNLQDCYSVLQEQVNALPPMRPAVYDEATGQWY